MEKIMYSLWKPDPSERHNQFRDRLLDAMVSMWVDSAMHRQPLEAILAQQTSRYDGYLVVESEPYPEERKRRAARYAVAEGARTYCRGKLRTRSNW